MLGLREACPHSAQEVCILVSILVHINFTMCIWPQCYMGFEYLWYYVLDCYLGFGIICVLMNINLLY
jgi:hypothetical protein